MSWYNLIANHRARDGAREERRKNKELQEKLDNLLSQDPGKLGSDKIRMSILGITRTQYKPEPDSCLWERVAYEERQWVEKRSRMIHHAESQSIVFDGYMIAGYNFNYLYVTVNGRFVLDVKCGDRHAVVQAATLDGLSDELTKHNMFSSSIECIFDQLDMVSLLCRPLPEEPYFEF